jgi:hypothetical protein
MAQSWPNREKVGKSSPIYERFFCDSLRPGSQIPEQGSFWANSKKRQPVNKS